MFKVFDARQLGHAPAREMHNGDWVPHVDTPARAQVVVDHLGALEPARDFGLEPIARVHAAEYLTFLQNAHRLWLEAGRGGDAIGYTWPIVRRRPLALDRIDAQLGRFSYDSGTPITAATWSSVYWGAQTALTGLQTLLDGEAATAFALCRPPGHHAGADYLGGYCYLNNAAIAARAAADAGRRVAILDIDYHHGNGTQDIFYGDGDVFFASIHGDPVTEYPFYWGHADEIGEGAGRGANLNLPLPRGTGLAGYLHALDTALAAISAHGAELVVVSFGADTYEADPICHFTIGTDDYPRIAERIAALGLATLVVMEGGYAVDALAANVTAFLSGFPGQRLSRQVLSSNGKGAADLVHSWNIRVRPRGGAARSQAVGPVAQRAGGTDLGHRRLGEVDAAGVDQAVGVLQLAAEAQRQLAVVGVRARPPADASPCARG